MNIPAKYYSFLPALLLSVQLLSAQLQIPKLRIGYSVSLEKITPESMAYAKANGIDCIEIAGISTWFEKGSRHFVKSDKEIDAQLRAVREATSAAGIEIWSVHMPFGKTIDLSMADESERMAVQRLQEKVLEFCKVLKPKIILFHPSYYLGINERERRKSQFLKSAVALNKRVKAMQATMVIENMLGPQLQLNDSTERPLGRTVEEVQEIMSRLPGDIYSAIDLNHISHPEKLIMAMGNRLRTLHVADGDGLKEWHYFPCNAKGKNDWPAILEALYKVGYSGPFMYECHFPDVKDLKPCYESLYMKTVQSE